MGMTSQLSALIALGSLLMVGCTVVVGEPPPPGVIVAAQQMHIPPGHYPPPGHCRLWYPDRPPGHQPPPVPCEQAAGVGSGVFILYNGKAWDAGYDWQAHARRHPGSVPHIIIQLTAKR
jgi:hypothetical protein